MITPTLESKSKLRSDPVASPLPRPVPEFSRLIIAAAFVNAPFVAFFLIAGKVWSAGSILAGVIISLAACGLLHLFVLRIMPALVAGMSGQIYRGAGNGVLVQFLALVVVKLLMLGLVGYAILNFREVNLPLVLIGFALAQTAIVVTVARHLKAHSLS